MKLKALSATIGLALVLAGCGNTPAEPPQTAGPATVTVTATPTPTSTPSVTPTPTPTPTPSTEPGENPAELPAFDEAEQTNNVGHANQGYEIKAVRVGTHAGYDRYVIEFQNGQGEVGWHTSYERPARTAGKGDDIELKGDATLVVTLEGMFAMGSAPAEFVHGKQATAAGAITESYVDPPFEAQGQVFIGVDTKRPYRAFWLDEPGRLVIDFLQ